MEQPFTKNQQLLRITLALFVKQDSKTRIVYGDWKGCVIKQSPAALDSLIRMGTVMILNAPAQKTIKFLGWTIPLERKPLPEKVAWIQVMTNRDVPYLKIVWFGSDNNQTLATYWANSIKENLHQQVLVDEGPASADLFGKYLE